MFKLKGAIIAWVLLFISGPLAPAARAGTNTPSQIASTQDKYPSWWLSSSSKIAQDKGFTEYLRNISLMPEIYSKWSGQAYAEAAIIFMKRREWSTAFEAAQKEYLLTHNCDDVILALAGLAKEGSPAEVDQAFRKIVAQSGKYDTEFLMLVLGYWKGYTVASRTFATVVVDKTATSDFYRAFGNELMQQGLPALAAVEYERANVLGDTSQELLSLLLTSYAMSNNHPSFEGTLNYMKANNFNMPGVEVQEVNFSNRKDIGSKATLEYPQWLAWAVPLRESGGITTSALWINGQLIYSPISRTKEAMIRSYDPVSGHLHWESKITADLPYSIESSTTHWRDRLINRISVQKAQIVADYTEFQERSTADGVSGRALGYGSISMDLNSGMILGKNFTPTSSISVISEKSYPVIHGKIRLDIRNKTLQAIAISSGKEIGRYPAFTNHPIITTKPYIVIAADEMGRILGLQIPNRLSRRRLVIAEIASKQKNPALAEEILDTALDADPGNGPAYKALAKLGHQHMLSSGAKSHLEQFSSYLQKGTDAYLAAERALPHVGYQGWNFAASGIEGSATDIRSIYLLTPDFLYALAKNSGQMRWRIALKGADRPFNNQVRQRLVLYKGTLYFSTGASTVMAVDPVSGNVLWQTQTPACHCGSALRSPLVSEDALFVSRSKYNNQNVSIETYGISARDGVAKWDSQVATNVPATIYMISPSASPVVWKDEVLFPTETGTLFAQDIHTGRILWSYTTEKMAGSDLNAIGDPTIKDGSVFFSSSNGFIYALDSATGSLKWKNKVGIVNPDTLAVFNHKIFFNHTDNFIWCLDAGDGHFLWKQESFFFSHRPVFIKGSLWGAKGSRVIALDPETGAVRGTQTFPSLKNIQWLDTDGNELFAETFDGVSQLNPFVLFQPPAE